MYKDKKVYAVVLAAGKGTRIGFDKMLYKLDGFEVAHRSVKAFSDIGLTISILSCTAGNPTTPRRAISGSVISSKISVFSDIIYLRSSLAHI